jgi:hypothetical protein
METELLRKIINVYMDEYKFIPFAIKNYIEGTWCLYSRDDQLLICQLINDRVILHTDKLAEDYYSKWLRLFGWMSSNVKLSEVK